MMALIASNCMAESEKDSWACIDEKCISDAIIDLDKIAYEKEIDTKEIRSALQISKKLIATLYMNSIIREKEISNLKSWNHALFRYLGYQNYLTQVKSRYTEYKIHILFKMRSNNGISDKDVEDTPKIAADYDNKIEAYKQEVEKSKNEIRSLSEKYGFPNPFK
jgi:hypothetical protein